MDNQIDGSSYINVSFRFTEEIKKIDFPFSGKITDLHYEKGKCEVRSGLTNILHCEPPSPYVVGETIVYAWFKGSDLTQKQGNITFFSFDIPILWETDRVMVTVRLPDGMFLSDRALLPVSPSGADKKIEGKKIIISWIFYDKNPGDVIPIRLYYESLFPEPLIERFDYRWLIPPIFILIIGLIIIYKKLPKKTELVFSKAKVSRIIQGLQARGVVDVERTGRKNRISLRKTMFKE
jgi:hypothetical protein